MQIEVSKQLFDHISVNEYIFILIMPIEQVQVEAAHSLIFQLCVGQPSQVLPVVKNLPAHIKGARDIWSLSGLGRSPGEGNGNPSQYSYLENSMDTGAWWATVHGVAKSLLLIHGWYSFRIQGFHPFAPPLSTLKDCNWISLWYWLIKSPLKSPLPKNRLMAQVAYFFRK